MSEEKTSISLPPSNLWPHLAKISIVEDKPIMLDYWVDSLEKKVVIGVRENNEILLVKNSEEYTSPVVKKFKLDKSLIICTENSIYLVSADIEKKRIQ
jgi:hypothetical protein